MSKAHEEAVRQLAHLRKLHAQSTPGEWGTRAAKGGFDPDVGITAPDCANVIAECFAEFAARGDVRPGQALLNAASIAALHNAFPHLAAMADWALVLAPLLRAARPLADVESPEGLKWMLDVRAALYGDNGKADTEAKRAKRQGTLANSGAMASIANQSPDVSAGNGSFRFGYGPPGKQRP